MKGMKPVVTEDSEFVNQILQKTKKKFLKTNLSYRDSNARHRNDKHLYS